MHIAVETFRLGIPGADSLKAKRMVVKSIKSKIRNRFNVSVAETGLHELQQSAEISIAVIADGRGAADSVLDRVDGWIEADGRVLIHHTEREFR